MKRSPKKPFERFYKKNNRPQLEPEEESLPKAKAKKPKRQPAKKRPPKGPRDRSAPSTQSVKAPTEPMRLNKYIAHSGICSRRKASEYIQKGEVTVNEVVVLEMGHKVQPGDVVRFRDKVVKPTRNHVYLLMNKPRNVITTSSDERGRRTVLDLVSDMTSERIYPVGRLDRNTTGLLILTNDGDFAQKLSHPSFQVKKVYKATLDKPLTEEDFEKIKQTLVLDDGPAPVDAIAYGKSNKVIGLEIHIGRNRIVRRIFEHLGYEVVKLDRVGYGALNKKNLPVGHCRFLTERERIVLQHLTR